MRKIVYFFSTPVSLLLLFCGHALGKEFPCPDIPHATHGYIMAGGDRLDVWILPLKNNKSVDRKKTLINVMNRNYLKITRPLFTCDVTGSVHDKTPNCMSSDGRSFHWDGQGYNMKIPNKSGGITEVIQLGETFSNGQEITSCKLRTHIEYDIYGVRENIPGSKPLPYLIIERSTQRLRDVMIYKGSDTQF